MLQLMAWAIDKGICSTETEYLDRIGFGRTNIAVLRRGERRFTTAQIQAACELTAASADWIFGLSNSMKRDPGSKAIDQLKQAVIAVESELKRK